MAIILDSAEHQIAELSRYYLEISRYEALERLNETIENFVTELDNAFPKGKPFPTPYPRLAKLKILWIKRHIYWLGYARSKNGVPILANVFWEGANIPKRATPLQEQKQHPPTD